MIYIILAKPHHKWRRTISEEMKKGAVDQNTIIYNTLLPEPRLWFVGSFGGLIRTPCRTDKTLHISTAVNPMSPWPALVPRTRNGIWVSANARLPTQAFHGHERAQKKHVAQHGFVR